MNIRLKNIGIIQDSFIEINGLTVIAGKNNSGKTTVGKAVYSLIDGVENMYQKSVHDRFSYAVDQIEKACECFPFHPTMKRRKDQIENECLKIFFSREYQDVIPPEKVDEYMTDLIHELQSFDVACEPYKGILETSSFGRRLRFGSDAPLENIGAYRKKAILILVETIEYIKGDAELVNYAKQSVNAALAVEFNGQIQPVALENAFSYIEMRNEGEPCFQISIKDNEVSDEDDAFIYWGSPYKKVYFIDNPFIIDEPAFRKRNKYTTTSISFVNEARIVTHDNKLKFILNYSRRISIFEEGILDERYRLIKEKMDSILPGEFMEDNGERFYVKDKIKLNCANLATGSKMFSIIKILLERGEIDENTLLILDEPESHLHPEWQNSFVEIIVLLVKEVGCHVLLTTHSSQFMLAVDAYMRKYNITSLCNFYQTESVDGGPFVSYRCVNDSLHLIYEDFVKYLSDVKLLRNKYLSDDNMGKAYDKKGCEQLY